MRLKAFFIGHYRVLKDLDLHFARVSDPLREDQEGYALDFLVGVNGTGKSTVLQLLGRLLTRLHTQEGRYSDFDVPVRLEYEIGSVEYGIGSVTVTLSNRPEDIEMEAPGSRPNLHYRIDNGDWVNSAERPLDAGSYLPSLVVYTTGELQDWRAMLQTGPADEAELSAESDERSKQEGYEWPGHRPQRMRREPLKGVRFIEPHHLPLVALCGLLADRWDQDGNKRDKLRYVLDEAQIDNLLGFSLKVRYLEDLHDPQSVKGVIDDLVPLAKRVVRQGSDWLLVFELDERPLGCKDWFGRVYEWPIQLFDALFRLALDEGDGGVALQDVALFLKRKAERSENDERYEKGMLQLFRWLSDGERSLIARMALLSLFRVHDYLILLDEPEVHFNDVWKRELINVLDQVMTGYRSHTLITTHSSIALTDVPRTSIRVMRRDGPTTTGEPHRPIIETFGADPSDVLVHVFGTPTATGERSVRYIQKKLSEPRMDEAKLSHLADVVAPGYWRYRIQLERQRLREVAPS